MARSWQWRQSDWSDPPEDPTVGGMVAWPMPAVLGLAVAGLISPVVPFAGAVLAYATADQDQGTFLLGAGLVHILLVLTLLPGG
jgi:hypothetical protein